MPKDSSDDHIRVGTAERERATTMLSEAFADGYLEIAEFEERTGAVIVAKTRGDLRAVLENLPIAGDLFPDAHPQPAGPPAMTPHPPTVLDIDWGTVKRRGNWVVPPTLYASGSMGTLDLDFRKASFAGPVIALQLDVSTSTVKLRLGPDDVLRHDDLACSGWSSVKDKSGEPRRPGGRSIVLSGSVSAMSSVTIKRP